MLNCLVLICTYLKIYYKNKKGGIATSVTRVISLLDKKLNEKLKI